jgi:transposase
MPIGLPAGSKIYLSLAPVDMRKGFDGLATQVQHLLSRDPFSGPLFLFRSRGGDRLKAVWWGRQRALPLRQAAGAGSIRLAAGRGGDGTPPEDIRNRKRSAANRRSR